MVSLLYFNYKCIPILLNNKCMFYDNIYENLYIYHDLRKGGKFEHAKYSGLDIVNFKKILFYIGFYSIYNYKKQFIQKMNYYH